MMVIESTLHAQSTKISDKTIKIYDGLYFGGKAHYSYLNDNEGERIFDGPFSFTLNNVPNLPGATIIMHGDFKNNLKNGLWTYVMSSKQYDNNLTSLKETLTSNYYLGMLNGIIKVSQTGTVSNQTGLVTGTATVANTNFIGEINYFARTVDRNGKILKSKEFNKLIGQFNNDGFCDGLWIWTYQDDSDNSSTIEAKMNFINGVLISSKAINEQTGEIGGRYDHPELIEYAKQLTGNKNQAVVNGEQEFWTIASLTADENLLKIANTFCDANLNSIPKGFIGEFPTFKIRTLIEFLDVKNDYNFKNAEIAFNNADFANAQEYYNEVLKNQHIRQNDKDYINNKLTTIKSTISQGNLMKLKNLVELNNLFTTILNSLDANSVNNLLMQEANYKVAYSGQINSSTTAISYLPLCCFGDYDSGSEFQAFKLQVDYKNNKPEMIHFMLGDNANERIARSEACINALLQDGFHVAFDGYQAVDGSGFKTKTERKEIGGPVDAYVPAIILTNDKLSYHFYNRQVLLISIAK